MAMNFKTADVAGLRLLLPRGRGPVEADHRPAARFSLVVLAGLLMFIGYVIDRDVRASGDTVNWLAFVEAAPRLLWNGGSDTLFSLVGGLFGALTAIRKAKPPDFTVVDKRHGACIGVSAMRRRGSGPGMDGTYIVRAIALCVLVVLLAFLMARRSTG